MSQPQVRGGGAPSEAAQPEKRSRKKRVRGPSSYAFTILEFCDQHRISRAQYYKLQKLGQGPDEARASNRTVIITAEAAARWREQRTAASKQQSPPGNAA
jgi:hypothetical protein